MQTMKMTQLPNIETVDRIHLDNKEDIMKVIEWAFEHKNVMDALTTDEYPLKEAVVKYSDIAYHHFKTYEDYEGHKGNLVLHSLFYYGELYLLFLTDLDKKRNLPLFVREEEKWGQEKLDKYLFESYVGIQALMAYMLHYREDFDYKEVRSQRNKKAKSGKKKKNTRVVRIGHYYVNIGTVTRRTEETRAYNRQSEAWRVRGHWRTYKSGKRVWIKPQVRGNKSGTIEPTTYKV